MEYNKTINLPKTNFPMRGNLVKKEPEMLQKWDEMGLEQIVREARKESPKYVMHDGPPYANGDIHLGHALNKTLKDIVVKFKTMQGYNVPFVPGWDTHGLPIEHQITKTKKVDRKKMSIPEFREECRQYALSYVRKQTEQFKRLGVRADWDNPYLTLHPEYEAEQIRVFGEMALNGYIYKGLKPVNWCTSCETALAEAEIEYGEKRSASIYVKFAVKDGKGVLTEGNTYVVIWTTTPWTLPANVAISVHPDFTYVLLKTDSDQLVVAKELVENFVKETEIKNYSIEGEFKGSQLEYVVCQHPFLERDSLVILGDHVTLEQGTGCVHTAPGHGHEDYLIGQKYNLPVIAPMNGRGIFTEEAGPFAGMHYDKANKEITKLLEDKGLLLALSFIKHSYPHCWRCKRPLIFRATEQWFATIDGFREEAVKAVEEVNWVPVWGEERMHNMIRDRGDWCISRQRTWGVPIPIFYCKECGESILTKETIDAVADLFAREGSSAWYVYDAEQILPKGFTCHKCGHGSFNKEKDIMDVWFDSGSSHRSVCKQNPAIDKWPVDLYLEGSDQYRGWFQSSLLTAMATVGQAPYKRVVTHGFVVDGKGFKMSKSQGNVISPLKLIDRYGADILRLWVTSADFKADVRISDDIIKQVAEVYRKIRNTCRFILGACNDFDREKHRVSYENLDELSRLLLHRLQKLVARVTQAYEDFELHYVYHDIHNFCVNDLSQFYLEIIKDTLYTDAANDVKRRSAQTVMDEVLSVLVRLIAPVLTFTAEEVWSHSKHSTQEPVTVQIAEWPVVAEQYQNEALEEKWAPLLRVRRDVSKLLETARKDKLIGNSLDAKVILYADPEWLEVLQQFKHELKDVFIVSQVELLPSTEMVGEVNRILEDEEGVLGALISSATGEKCERCWQYSKTVGKHEIHSTLCDRCVKVVESL